MPGQRPKLSLTPYTVDDKGNISLETSKSFEVMLNPSAFSHSYSIRYNQEKVLGQAGGESKFSAVDPDKVNFDVVFDGTGVVDTGSASPTDVKTQINKLEDVVYSYVGDSHQPNYVRVLWSSLLFFGRLESMSVDYTLFKPTGAPLRAKVKLSFVGSVTKQEEAHRTNKSSPDLTHIIEVNAGDNLALLCHRIYKDSQYYPDVARANNLSHFSDIKPGDRLYFPPLR